MWAVIVLPLLWLVAAFTSSEQALVVMHQQNSLAWLKFKKLFNKSYPSTTEELSRKQIFLANVMLIDDHNRLADDGWKTFHLGINRYSDMAHEEFVHIMNGYRPGNQPQRHNTPTYSPHKFALPDVVDWRKRGYVTAVKDQGQCGSCWAFSSTGCLEGQTFNKTGRLVSLSEQNLVDCSLVWGNNGCEGGTMDNAYHYIADNYGIDTEDSYPYTAKDGTCHYSKQSKGASDSGFVDLTRGSEAALKEAVATIGPISVAIDASQQSFQLYMTGIYNEFACTDQVDHAVLVVGYGTLGSQDYWLVKNSWGESWGENGYILMSRNLDNQCGIASMASYPVV